VEKRISMKLIHFVSLASLIWLTGCATTSQPPTEPTTTTTASQATATVAVPVIVAPTPPPHVAVFPDGPMQPIAEARTSSQSVARLLPPADLWERIRRGFAMPNLNNDLVQSQEQWYSTRPEYIQRMTERSRKYLFHIVEELERRNMPSELALLPFIESAFNPQAVSSAKAAGMWQFIPSTGRSFDLKQNVFRDDRRDVLASTRAALDYLQKLHGMFGDWHLALASYNWGEGSVGRAIAKNQKAGLGTAYTDLHMPNETRNYVPKLQAVKNIVANPDNFRATLPLIDNHPYFQSVDITRDIDVELAARLADVNIEDFKALNPSANRPVILAAGTPQILLPWDNATIFEMGMESYKTSGQLATWTAWVAPKTMTPAEAAKLVGMKEIDLRSVNHIPPKMLVKVGSTLMVPRDQHKVADVSHQVADNAQLSLTPEIILHKTQIKAGKGETVASVAKRYKISPNIVAEWNKTTAGASFKPGQQVVLFLPARAKTKPGANASQIAKKPPTKSAPVAKVNIAKR
jgi:membrane-bound lytic murein transglycosylase D